jgi:flagellar biosynthesis GTPase FlhF
MFNDQSAAMPTTDTSPAMTRFSSLARAAALMALVWMTVLPGAQAQQTRTLEIRDGTVFVDGQPLPSEQVPSGLDLEGVQAQYRFVGIARPVVEIQGRLFAVEEGLTPVSPEDVRAEQASVVLQNRNGARSAAAATEGSADAGTEQYLNDVQRASRQLYERLLRERRMEERARELAQMVRLLPEGGKRQMRLDSLRSMLNDIFALKQENRRREIEHLQRKIQELQRSIQKRAGMREVMIDRRLQQLVGATPEQ